MANRLCQQTSYQPYSTFSLTKILWNDAATDDDDDDAADTIVLIFLLKL